MKVTLMGSVLTVGALLLTPSFALAQQSGSKRVQAGSAERMNAPGIGKPDPARSSPRVGDAAVLWRFR